VKVFILKSVASIDIKQKLKSLIPNWPSIFFGVVAVGYLLQAIYADSHGQQPDVNPAFIAFTASIVSIILSQQRKK